MELDDTTKVHLVLSAGGLRVISYVGALSVLAERNISFASVSACSGGTFIGALLCAGKTPAEIEKWVFDLDFSSYMGERVYPKFLRILSFSKWPFAEYKQSRFSELFCNLLQDNPKFKDLKIPFATAGVDIATNRILVYSSETHPEMYVSEAIRIAVALPLMYPPHEKERRIVMDAAITSQSPVWLVPAHRDELPILVLKPARPSEVYNPKNVVEYLTDIFLSSVGSRDDYLIKQIPRVRAIEIDCGHINGTQVNISKRERDFLIMQGRTSTEDELSRLGDDLSNINIMPESVPTGDTHDDAADKAGEKRITDFLRSISDQYKYVFISYSHDDKEWLEKLQTHLKPYTRNASVTAWDDTNIQSGAKWRQEIEKALGLAKVAVLLVSPNFLASDFIAQYELPPLLEAAEKRGLTILWIPVGHSAYKETKIAEYQAASGCNPDTPLSSLPEAEQDRIFVQICEQIKAMLNP